MTNEKNTFLNKATLWLRKVLIYIADRIVIAGFMIAILAWLLYGILNIRTIF